MTTKPPIDDGRSLEELLLAIPEPMRSALHEQEPEFARECALDYLTAEPDGQADMLAFFESDGPKKVDQAKQKHEHGTPTSADLEEWLGKDGPA